MPISSAYISGMVSNQQVMFANNASYSQQISSSYLGTPQQQGMMSAPQFRSYGADHYGAESLAGTTGMGAAAMMAPAAASVGTMMAGFAGGAAGWLDPFTGVARGFAAGSGAGFGAGFGQTMSHIGGAFGRGVGAGAGAIGSGLAGAAMAAVPYYIAGAAIQKTATSMYEGVQNVADVTRMTSQMGPFYGASFRPGGGMGRGQIEDIVKTLETVASEDALRSVQSMKNLLSRFTQLGMMTGVSDISSFQTKFKQLTEQVTSVAKIMGTSLEEAAPLLRNMQQMGLWKPQDIFGAVTAMNMVGRNAQPQLMGAMQTGAQISWQMGGTLGSGATMARNQFLRIQSAMRTGNLSEEELMNLTGGVGGVEGQRMLAEQQTQTVSRFATHPMGRLMIAGMGEVKDGSYTGNIDKGALQKFMMGGANIWDIERSGRANTRTKEGAASFTLRAENIGQEMMAQGGDQAIAQALNLIVNKAGYGNAKEGIQGIFIQKVMGVNAREAEYWRKMIEDLPRLQEDQSRRALDAMDDQFQRLDERMNRSFEGFSTALEHEWEKTWEPVREFGVKMTTSYQQSIDKFDDWWYNRRRTMRIGREQRLRMLAEGAGLATAGGFGGRIDQNSTIPELIRSGGVGRGDALAQLGVSGRFVEGDAAVGAGEVGLDLRYSTQPGTVQSQFVKKRFIADEGLLVEAGKRAIQRAQDSSMEGLGFTKAGDDKSMETVKQAMSNVFMSTEGRRELREAREVAGNNHGKYINSAIEILKKRGGPQAAQAIEALKKSRGGDVRMGGVVEQDILAAAVQGGAIVPMDLSLDFKGQASRISEGAMSYMFMGDEEYRKAEKANLDLIAADLTGGQGFFGGLTSVMAQSARVMAGGAAMVATAPLTGLGGFLSGFHETEGIFSGIGAGVKKALSSNLGVASAVYSGLGGVTETSIEEAFNSDWGLDMVDFINSGADPNVNMDNKFLKAASSGKDPKALKMLNMILERRDNGTLGSLKEHANTRRSIASAKVGKESRIRAADAAKETLASMENYSAKQLGISEDALKGFKSILETQAGQGDAGEAMMRLAAGLSDKEAQSMRGMGSTGMMISGMKLVQGLGTSGMTKEQAEAFKKKFVSSMGGTDLIKSLGWEKEFSEDVASGGSFSTEEQKRWASKLGGVMKMPGLTSETTAGRREAADSQMRYIEAQTKFASVVGTALTGIMGGKDMKEVRTEIEKLGYEAEKNGTRKPK